MPCVCACARWNAKWKCISNVILPQFPFSLGAFPFALPHLPQPRIQLQLALSVFRWKDLLTLLDLLTRTPNPRNHNSHHLHVSESVSNLQGVKGYSSHCATPFVATRGKAVVQHSNGSYYNFYGSPDQPHMLGTYAGKPRDPRMSQDMLLVALSCSRASPADCVLKWTRW